MSKHKHYVTTANAEAIAKGMAEARKKHVPPTTMSIVPEGEEPTGSVSIAPLHGSDDMHVLKAGVYADDAEEGEIVLPTKGLKALAALLQTYLGNPDTTALHSKIAELEERIRARDNLTAQAIWIGDALGEQRVMDEIIRMKAMHGAQVIEKLVEDIPSIPKNYPSSFVVHWLQETANEYRRRGHV